MALHRATAAKRLQKEAGSNNESTVAFSVRNGAVETLTGRVSGEHLQFTRVLISRQVLFLARFFAPIFNRFQQPEFPQQLNQFFHGEGRS